MFDEDYGPFTRAELASIDDALRSSTALTPPDKAAVLLCRDWGLRPIQLALLTTSDLGHDEGGPFVLVPSVKGRVRSRMRRHAENRRKRYVADDTALAIQETLDWYRPEVDAALENFKTLPLDFEGIDIIERPIFARFRTGESLARYLNDKSLRPYTLVTESHALSARLLDIGPKLAISSGKDGSDVLQISASRFRYTKGVMLALQGFSVEYIAEALDHRSIATVKHYCRYSMQLAAYINSVASRSAEILSAINLWKGKLVTDAEYSLAIANGERPVGRLGLCKKMGPCGFWPTVSCYSCSLFRPNRAANHREAANHIANERKTWELGADDASLNLFQVAHDRAIQLAEVIERETEHA